MMEAVAASIALMLIGTWLIVLGVIAFFWARYDPDL